MRRGGSRLSSSTLVCFGLVLSYFGTTASNTCAQDLFVMDQVNKTLCAMNLDGSARSTVLNFAANPWDITLDEAAGRMYWTESDKVMSANLDGTSQQVLWHPGPVA